LQFVGKALKPSVAVTTFHAAAKRGHCTTGFPVEKFKQCQRIREMPNFVVVKIDMNHYWWWLPYVLFRAT
jgi:hypothetical protein